MKFLFNPEEIQNHYLNEQIKSFGKILEDSNFYIFKNCPDNMQGDKTFKIEVDVGYYECRKCHYKYHSNYFFALLAPHVFTTRFMKCPKCHKWSWARKVLSKEK